jgi:hypothetical protein
MKSPILRKLIIARYSRFVLLGGMPRTREESVLFLVKMALRRALKVVRGLRRLISDTDEGIMAKKLVDDLRVSGWEIRQRPDAPRAGFTFEPPDGPEKQ